MKDRGGLYRQSSVLLRDEVAAGHLSVLAAYVTSSLVDALAVINSTLQDLGDLAPLAAHRFFV